MATQVPRTLLTAPTLEPMMSDLWASVSSLICKAGWLRALKRTSGPFLI